MFLYYTHHAEEKIEKRKIHKIWIEEAIKSPDCTERDHDKFIVRKKLNGISIEVIYIKEEKVYKVVTVYWI